MEPRRLTQCSTDQWSSEVPLPEEVRIATSCAQALDRGDKGEAVRLAELGLRLAQDKPSPKWVHRFEHLLRLANGTSLPSLPYEPPKCSFCLQVAKNVVAGPKAYICDRCVRRCAAQELEGSPIRRISADDLRCSFCAARSATPLFVGDGYSICQECIERCVAILSEG